MIGLFQKTTFALIDCLTGELREITKMPFEIGSGEAADLRIEDERICERHCVVLEANGKTYIAKRDPLAAFILDGVERESSVLATATDYCVKLGSKFFVLRGSPDVGQWRDRLRHDAWCLAVEAQEVDQRLAESGDWGAEFEGVVRTMPVVVVEEEGEAG